MDAHIGHEDSRNIPKDTDRSLPRIRAYPCKRCRNRYPTVASLEEHASTHRGGKFECSRCKKSFKYFNEVMIHHMQNHVSQEDLSVLNKKSQRKESVGEMKQYRDSYIKNRNTSCESTSNYDRYLKEICKNYDSQVILNPLSKNLVTKYSSKSYKSKRRTKHKEKKSKRRSKRKENRIKRRSKLKEKRVHKSNSFICDKASVNIEETQSHRYENNFNKKTESIIQHNKLSEELFIQLKSHENSDKNIIEKEGSEIDYSYKKQSNVELDIECICTQLNSLPCRPGEKCYCNMDFSNQVPNYILELFRIMPENNIIIVDTDKIVYL
ncbi:unnamed protein product [Meganyctiphanes norvegica]|uniref:C2H2-type domain-containing protein n=1 Tax=Meganyctiphanes norvegica TaxID=48144 RepID=A0AAV2S498_MEGNR